ncbi:leucine-rich repeat-containing protein 74A-like, partial [Lineus longissimus]|uniref:leucine-rich repeat-containing protein 74A-like n=1 Tax=Lineus longissimus TaxID=88925 RepID=UPI00315CC632
TDDIVPDVIKKFDNDSGWDTDLDEDDEGKLNFDVTGKNIYLETCNEMGVVPASYFIRHMNDTTLVMKHHGLGAHGAKAIAVPLCTNTTVLSLDLEDNSLEAEGAHCIADMLRDNCYITELNVSRNYIASDGARAICDMLPTNRTLAKLNMSWNGLKDKDAEFLSTFILENNRVKELNLSHNEFSDVGGDLLGPAIAENETLDKLDLSWNHLRRSGGVAVVDGIKNNARLKVCNLAFNGLGTEGAAAVADLLKQNNVLLDLDISNNRITAEGALLVSRGLDANETLKSFKMGSNPICTTGALFILKAIHNERSVLTNLDLSNTQVDKEFIEMKKEIQSSRVIQILHGKVVGDFEVKGSARQLSISTDEDLSNFLGTPLDVFLKTDPMAILRAYVDKKNLRLIDFFNTVDKDKNYKISAEEFKKGVQMANIGLTDDQIDRLVRRLDSVETDGMIDYRELCEGNVAYIKERRRVTKLTQDLLKKKVEERPDDKLLMGLRTDGSRSPFITPLGSPKSGRSPRASPTLDVGAAEQHYLSREIVSSV